MSKNLSIVEDLIDLIPTSPFSVSLDNKIEQKNTLILSESLSFDESDELLGTEQITLYTAEVKMYLESEPENTNFADILLLLKSFYDSVKGLECSRYKEKFVFSVNREGLFGYLGRDKSGAYCFSLNMRVQYYV